MLSNYQITRTEATLHRTPPQPPHLGGTSDNKRGASAASALEALPPPGRAISLKGTKAGMMFDEATANQLRALVEKGVLGAGVFNTPNCQATYEEMKSKGVEFVAPPEDKFYGIEAIFKDNSGNWFSLTQPKPH
jgi:hypothetical protein